MGFEMSTFDNGLSAENIFRASRMFDERVTSEPWTFTTEKSPIEERAFNDLLLTTAEPITETVEHERRSFKGEIEPEDDATDASEVDTDKRGNPIETTTTSSTVNFFLNYQCEKHFYYSSQHQQKNILVYLKMITNVNSILKNLSKH
jgi:hypothetical protein